MAVVLGGRVGRSHSVQNATAIMGEYQKHVKQVETGMPHLPQPPRFW